MYRKNNLTKIESNAFEGCIGLTEIIIPANVTIVWWWAFYRCDNLMAITFENTYGWYAAGAIDGGTGRPYNGRTTTVENATYNAELLTKTDPGRILYKD